jgi:ribonuclease P protein component
MLKPNILRRKKDFSILYSRGKSIGDKYVVLFYKKNGLSYNRVAFLASKKVGNSVFRNRARRLMKESYRDLEKEFKTGHDLIIIGRNTINGIKCQDVHKSLRSAANRGNLLEINK